MDIDSEKYGKGDLLIANGNLMDPNFKRMVVLLCEHNENGSYGLILNNPTQTPISKLAPDHDLLKNEDSPVYVGGPCQMDRLQVLHGFGSLLSDTIRICENVFMSGDFDAVLRIKSQDKESGGKCRFYLGYSGWGPGQLESEMERKSWIIHPANNKIVFSMDHENMWKEILDSKGGYYSFHSTMPPDIRAN
ncbi:MAG: YqgE/AlgH family protein [bacterium]